MHSAYRREEYSLIALDRFSVGDGMFTPLNGLFKDLVISEFTRPGSCASCRSGSLCSAGEIRHSMAACESIGLIWFVLFVGSGIDWQPTEGVAQKNMQCSHSDHDHKRHSQQK